MSSPSYWELTRTRIKKFRAFLGPSIWKMFLLSVVIGVLAFLVEFSFVYVLQGFFRTIGLVSSENLFLPPWYPHSLAASLTILVLFGIFRSSVVFGKTFISGLIQQSFLSVQRQRILRFALRDQSRFSTSEIISNFSDRSTQAGFFIMGIAHSLTLSVTAGLMAIAGLWLAPVEFLAGGAFFAIFYFPLVKLNNRINRSGIGISDEWAKITNTLIFGIRNAFLLKIYNRNESEALEGELALRRYLHHFFNYFRILGVKAIAPNVVGVVGITLITFISLQIGQTQPMRLVSLFYIFLRLAQTMGELGTYSSDARIYFQNFKGLYALILDMQAHEKHIEGRSAKPAPRLQFQSLRLENVGFSYEQGRPVLSGINLDLKSNGVLLIKGESGAGKSTLIGLMCGLVSPTEGRVFVNGRPLSEVQTSFAEAIGYVGPEPYLFPGGLRANLLYPDLEKQVDDKQIWEALEKAQAASLVRERPLGLAGLYTEDSNFSTGQKQRLSLARALLRNPSVLILDEATANIDLETEFKIKELIVELKERMLILIISHRSTFDDIADQKIQLKSNR